MAATLFNEKEKTKSISGEVMYEQWIPLIYDGDLPDSVWNIVGAVGEGAFKDFKRFLVHHRMKGGSMFSKDKTEGILAYYLIAGFLLRYVELK